MEAPTLMQIYQSRIVLLQQLEKQGFNISEYATFTVHDVEIMNQHSQLDMLMNTLPVLGSPGRKVYVHYSLCTVEKPDKIKLKAEIPRIIEDIYEIERVLTPIDTLIIVVNASYNDKVEPQLECIYETKKYFIILFQMKNLQYNILNHSLVFPHRILDKTEKFEVMKKYNIISDEQFPDISRFDAVAKVIGMRPGEVCEIIRSSITAITTPY